MNTTINGILRRLGNLGDKINTLATLLGKVDAKTQRAGATITGPISIGSQDIPITWSTPWPDTTYAVLIGIQSGTAALGNVHATLKAASKTVNGCTVTVSFLAAVGADVGLDVIGIRT